MELLIGISLIFIGWIVTICCAVKISNSIILWKTIFWSTLFQISMLSCLVGMKIAFNSYLDNTLVASYTKVESYSDTINNYIRTEKVTVHKHHKHN